MQPARSRPAARPGPGGDYDYAWVQLIEEGLRTGAFGDRWIAVGANDFYVPLYDDSGLAP